jgi:membrane protease YdiL (CAAX protease family)
MMILIVVGFVMLVLYERGERGCARERVRFTPWGAEDVLFAVAVFFLGLLSSRLILSAFPPGTFDAWVPAMLVSVSMGLACAAVFLELRFRYGLWPADVGLRVERLGPDLLLALGMLVYLLGMRTPMSALVDYVYQSAGEQIQRQYVIQQMLDARSTWGLAAMMVMAAGVAPVCEEIAFRGFVQPFLRRYVGGAGSVVLTAVAFSLMHDPGSKFLAVPVLIFPLALALGYCRERTQRLTAPILLHALHNLVGVVAVLAQRGGA